MTGKADNSIARVTGIHTAITAPAIGTDASTETDAIMLTGAGTLVLKNRDGTLANYGANVAVGVWHSIKTIGLGTGNTASVMFGYSR